MNRKAQGFLKNFSFVMFANLYSLLVATLITFIVPKFFSEETYSYFQLENLYCAYIAIITLGFGQGYYLKYGGMKKEKINKNEYSSIYLLNILYSFIVICILLAVRCFMFRTNENKSFVFLMSSLSLTIEMCYLSLATMFQATNDMKKYSIICFLDRTIYLLFVVSLLLTDHKGFKLLIIADIVSKFIMFLITLYMARDFLFGKISINKDILKKTGSIIAVGFSLLLAGYASNMINSVTRFAIEHTWGLITFGKISLTLTISNVFTKFISAVSLVLFPTLRNTGDDNRVGVYNSLNIILSIIMLAAFCFYRPMVYVLGEFLPGYSESLKYVAVLLPVSLFETKVTMLVNTYLNVVNRQREILYSNIFAVVLSIVLAFISTVLLKNLDVALVSIVIVLAARCYFAEFRLSKFMKIKRTKLDIVIMAAVFIIANWLIGGIVGTAIYILSFILYILKNLKAIKQAKLFVFGLIKR